MDDINAKFVIIGAGPVGLYTAIKLIQTKQVTNKTPIIILEKYDKFSREQILLLSPQQLSNFPPDLKKILFDEKKSPGCYRLPPLYDDYGYCYTNQFEINIPGSGSDTKTKIPATIETNILQEYLLNYLFKIGGSEIYVYILVTNINISKNNSINFTHMSNKNEKESVNINYKYLISAEGSKSIVRDNILKLNITKKIYKNKLLNNVLLSSGIIILLNLDDTLSSTREYQNTMKSDNIKIFNNKTPFEQQHRFRFFRNKKNLSYLGIQITNLYKLELDNELNNIDKSLFIDDKVNKLQSLNNTVTLLKTYKDKPKLLQLTKLIIEYLNKIELNVNKINYRKISTIDIKPFYVSSFSNIEDKNTNKFIIGDALYGTNFFSGTGVNSGFEFANIIIKWIKDNDNIYMEKKYNNEYIIMYNEIIEKIKNRTNLLKRISSSPNVVGRQKTYNNIINSLLNDESNN
jgi:flavin-dependent dehydrogenase